MQLSRPHKYIWWYTLLFALLFIYRFAFRDDFRVAEIIQITLTALSDLILIIASLKVIDKVRNWIIGQFSGWLNNVLFILSIVAVYGIGVFTLYYVHYGIYLITTGLTEDFERVFNSLSYQIFDSYLVLAVGMIFLTGSKYYQKWLDQRKINVQLEKERVRAELDYLKAQINPHFVFNTLNNLYFLVDESNSKARRLIHEFSDLLRYQLYETGNQLVSLNDEVEYLRKYIAIQKIRKEEGFAVQFNVSGNLSQEVAPLLMIIPLENAFKYSESGAGGRITVDLDSDGDRVRYKVENTISQKVTSERTRGGLGLENLRKRLTLIYGERASFSLDLNGDIAIAELEVNWETDEA